ncbi:MAG: cation diffusion facilitator family transporter [Woeseiaceae bacterium]|nr:cation diffusion facilitator family transporter [Woeseiaceae bacterium]
MRRRRRHERRTRSTANSRRVLIALCLTALFTVVEAVAGWLTGSLALLADAGHMLTDTMALGLAAVAFRISRRPADPRRSYGYQRFQILAAFVNGITLVFIVGWIVIEAASAACWSRPQDGQATRHVATSPVPGSSSTSSRLPCYTVAIART